MYFPEKLYVAFEFHLLIPNRHLEIINDVFSIFILNSNSDVPYNISKTVSNFAPSLMTSDANIKI